MVTAPHDLPRTVGELRASGHRERGVKAEIRENLLAALKQAGDPNVRFRVKSFRDVPFRIVGTFRVAADYPPELVKGAVDAALKLIKKQPVERFVNVPFELVTPENRGNFMGKN